MIEVKTPHSQLEIIELSVLKEWSQLDNATVLFDSDLKGNGFRTLDKTVFGKKNLYFITFDFNNNVYGGYLNTKVNSIDNWLQDDKSFVFSLMRNGEMKNRKYEIDLDAVLYSFKIYSKDPDYVLYQFELGDISVTKIGLAQSYCGQTSYNYKGDKKALVDKFYPPFGLQRIIIVEMS
ncbi:TLDc domain-containing protein [Entamoeba marina]